MVFLVFSWCFPGFPGVFLGFSWCFPGILGCFAVGVLFGRWFSSIFFQALLGKDYFSVDGTICNGFKAPFFVYSGDKW